MDDFLSILEPPAKLFSHQKFGFTAYTNSRFTDPVKLMESPLVAQRSQDE
jgi:hypothetical protein